MFLKIFLCSSVIVVASANNVIPAQTYPIYQQNGYMNPQANLPNNIQSYLQSGTAQNKLQQLNISPSSIKQALLNRLLTGQSRQANSNPNTNSYSSNLNGVQNNHIPANIANNYVVVPRDYLKNHTSYSNNDTNTNRNNTKKNKQSKRRSKLRRQSDAEKIGDNQNQNKSVQLNTNNTKNTKIVQNTTEYNKSSRKNTRKENPQVTETTSKNTTNAENENNNRTRRRKKKQKEGVTTTTESPIKEENIVQNSKSHKRRKKQKVNENSEPENQVVAKTKPKEIENVDLDITNEGMNNENRLTRNSKQETNDLLKSIPNTKEIPNHFLTNLSQFNNPLMGTWFANYENLFQSLANQSAVIQVNDTKPKRRRKSKRTKKSRRKNKQNRNVTENTSKVNSVDIDSTTMERSITFNERTQTNFNSNIPEDTSKSFENRDLSSNEIFKDGYNINEFENRYNTGYYEGYIDDYYPLFTDSAAYNANNKEIILRNLNDNKYYYATDTIDTDLKNKNHNNDRERTHMFNTYERNKHTYDEIEKESIRNAYKKEFDDKIEEELQFRSPPHLESPDFKTTQIDKSKLKPEVYYVYPNYFNTPNEDKSSSYSTAKTPYSSGAKRNEIKTQPKDVETVYAKSKVVSYGPVYTPAEDSSSTASSSDYDSSSDTSRSGDIIYVKAKSLGHTEY